MRKLHIRKHKTQEADGVVYQITDVELICGNPFDPAKLADTFWGTFETSLSEVDEERNNLFFGKEKRGLKRMRQSIRNTSRILKEAFCGWIASIDVEGDPHPYAFGEDCLFIFINYTDTLQER